MHKIESTSKAALHLHHTKTKWIAGSSRQTWWRSLWTCRPEQGKASNCTLAYTLLALPQDLLAEANCGFMYPLRKVPGEHICFCLQQSWIQSTELRAQHDILVGIETWLFNPRVRDQNSSLALLLIWARALAETPGFQTLVCLSAPGADASSAHPQGFCKA